MRGLLQLVVSQVVKVKIAHRRRRRRRQQQFELQYIALTDVLYCRAEILIEQLREHLMLEGRDGMNRQSYRQLLAVFRAFMLERARCVDSHRDLRFLNSAITSSCSSKNSASMTSRRCDKRSSASQY